AEWVAPHLYVPITKVVKTKEDVLTQLWDISSIDRREVTGRVYPLEEAAAHLIGYAGPITAEELENAEPGAYGTHDMIGKRGLELVFEETLKGERGLTIVVERENDEDVVLAEKPVQHGEDVQLTIQSFVQKEMYESYDGEAGTAAAI